MKFTIMPERMAEITDGKDKCLISIGSPKGRAPSFMYPWKKILRLEFDDLCPEECSSIGRKDLLEDARLFSEQDAVKIFQFVSENSDSDFVVHCKQGVSRSPAIALFLAEKFGEIGNTKDYLERNCRPNPHVTKVINRVYDEIFKDGKYE